MCREWVSLLVLADCLTMEGQGAIWRKPGIDVFVLQMAQQEAN